MLTKERLEEICIEALENAQKKFWELGERRTKKVEKNRFGETALLVDIECEKAVINTFRRYKIPVIIISEEHGEVNIAAELTQEARKKDEQCPEIKPEYFAMLDGLDGSYCLARNENDEHGTMLGFYFGTNPKYDDYLFSGIMQSERRTMTWARKSKPGTFQATYTKTGRMRKADSVKSSGKTVFDPETRIIVDEAPGTDFGILNKEMFIDRLLEGYSHQFIWTTAGNFARLAIGEADVSFECTRKGNLEQISSYGMMKQAGAYVCSVKGEELGNKKVRQYGQKEHIGMIFSATKELAHDAIKKLKLS